LSLDIVELTWIYVSEESQAFPAPRPNDFLPKSTELRNPGPELILPPREEDFELGESDREDSFS
jgi:hypothetical protein